MKLNKTHSTIFLILAAVCALLAVTAEADRNEDTGADRNVEIEEGASIYKMRPLCY